MDKNLRAYMAELIGTFALVFVSAGAVCVNYLAGITWPPEPNFPTDVVIVQAQPGLVGIALAAGFIYAAALAFTLPLSGGYLNPAITLMLWVFKRLDGARATGLIFVQLLGAALAGGLLRLLFSFREGVLTAVHLGTPHVNLRVFDTAGITPGVLLSGIAMELALTLILTIVIFGTLIDPRASRWLGQLGKRLIPLWVGLALAACILVGFFLTGAAVNPARWFGTVIWEWTVPSLKLQKPFSDQLVFWFGPIAGALLGGAVYTLVILPSEEDQKAVAGAPAASGKMAATGAGTLFRTKK